jgi:hypothetical protein
MTGMESEDEEENTSTGASEFAGRHPGTLGLLRFFKYEHLPENLQRISKPCDLLARDLIRTLPDGPELTAGLRKLLEAKDCFVRAGLPALRS